MARRAMRERVGNSMDVHCRGQPAAGGRGRVGTAWMFIVEAADWAGVVISQRQEVGVGLRGSTASDEKEVQLGHGDAGIRERTGPGGVSTVWLGVSGDETHRTYREYFVIRVSDPYIFTMAASPPGDGERTNGGSTERAWRKRPSSSCPGARATKQGGRYGLHRPIVHIRRL